MRLRFMEFAGFVVAAWDFPSFWVLKFRFRVLGFGVTPGVINVDPRTVNHREGGNNHREVYRNSRP